MIWNTDLHGIDPVELCRAMPVVTVMGGEVVYADPELEPRASAKPALDAAGAMRREGGR